MDIVNLTKNDGTTEGIEIVMTFKIEQFNNDDYVIYKSNNDYYGAKYFEEGGNTRLITNLTNEEKDALSNLFDKLCDGGVI